MELTAAVLAVRVDLMLKAELRLHLHQSAFWTDSTSMLKYKKNEDKRFHTFVANRISIIRGATNTSKWRYVSSKENPADAATRGVRVKDLIHNNKWIDGPKFLQKPESNWSTNLVEYALEAGNPEIKREASVNAVGVKNSAAATSQLIDYYSDWMKLKVAVAWILKVKKTLLGIIHGRQLQEALNSRKAISHVDNHGTKAKSGKVALSSEDLLEAELAIIQYCQQQPFEEEISMLSSGKTTASRKSPIYRLDPYLDNGLLRVGGRLTKGSLPEETKHALILSKDQHVATLILKHIHRSVRLQTKTCYLKACD